MLLLLLVVVFFFFFFECGYWLEDKWYNPSIFFQSQTLSVGDIKSQNVQFVNKKVTFGRLFWKVYVYHQINSNPCKQQFYEHQ